MRNLEKKLMNEIEFDWIEKIIKIKEKEIEIEIHLHTLMGSVECTAGSPRATTVKYHKIIASCPATSPSKSKSTIATQSTLHRLLLGHLRKTTKKKVKKKNRKKKQQKVTLLTRRYGLLLIYRSVSKTSNIPSHPALFSTGCNHYLHFIAANVDAGRFRLIRGQQRWHLHCQVHR